MSEENNLLKSEFALLLEQKKNASVRDLQFLTDAAAVASEIFVTKEQYTKLLWFAAKHISNTDPAFSLSSPAEVVEYLEGEIEK